MKILNRWNGETLFESESTETVAQCLAEALKASADLSGANLRSADLRSAKTDDKTSLPAFQIPQEGALIVFKRVRGGVCKLQIPEAAGRTASVVGRKCRAAFVEVLEAPEDGRGLHDSTTVYRAGETVVPDFYDPNPLVECTHGIHFFLTREEAEEYQ